MEARTSSRLVREGSFSGKGPSSHVSTRGGRRISKLAITGFTTLLAVCLVLAGLSALATSTIEAQSTQVRVNVTPENFGTYFDVDANGVATLDPAYANDHVLSFGPGEFPYAIRVQTASNVVLRGTNARDPAQASRIKAG